MKTNPVQFNIAKSIAIIGISMLSACGNESAPPPENKDTVAVKQEQPQTNEGFYDIPPPIQQVQLLQEAGATYDKSILNSLDNVSKYSVTNSKALNLGVYGADLSYASVFNKSQDAILYLTASKKLSDALGIKGDFYTNVMKRMEANNGSKDSLLVIVSYVYRKSNQALKENDQSHISALVVAGSFIEAMYIGTQVARTVKNKDAIYNRIGEFRGSLNNLVALITTVHESDFAEVLADLKTLKAIYDQSSMSQLNDDQMEKITKEVKAIRIKITNM